MNKLHLIVFIAKLLGCNVIYTEDNKVKKIEKTIKEEFEKATEKAVKNFLLKMKSNSIKKCLKCKYVVFYDGIYYCLKYLDECTRDLNKNCKFFKED